MILSLFPILVESLDKKRPITVNFWVSFSPRVACGGQNYILVISSFYVVVFHIFSLPVVSTALTHHRAQKTVRKKPKNMSQNAQVGVEF